MDIAFDNSYARLPENFYARQVPSQVPDPQLIRLNQALARRLNLCVVLVAPLASVSR